MSTRTPALLLALLAACTRDAPPPEAPVTGTPPVVTADYTPPPPSEPTPIQPTPIQPTPSEPTPITHAPIVSGPPGPITGAPPLRTPPPAPDAPAAIAIAVASVQISQNCPDEPNPVPPARPIASDASMHVSDMKESQSRSPRIGPPTCDQSTLQLSLTNTGGRTSTLQLEQVRILDSTGKRVLGTLPSRKPTFWSADTYQPWNQQVPGNLTAQVAYRLGEPVWQGGNVVALELQPYFVEVIVKVDGRKRTIRSAEFIPRTFDLVET